MWVCVGGGAAIVCCSSTMSRSVSLSGVALLYFGDGCGVMDARRTVVLSGIMVALMEGLARSMR
jgi:hypothetical protein